MIRIHWSAGILGAVLLLCAVGPMSARAMDLEKLVMPGEVIQAHAHIESECSKCHAPFQAEAQADLCIDCHREVGDDIRDSAGFHGRAAGAAQAECNSCHGEHEGRDADVVGLDRAAFDHDLTDHSLRGGHLRVACERCHAQEERFGQASSAESTAPGAISSARGWRRDSTTTRPDSVWRPSTARSTVRSAIPPSST